MMKLSIDRGKYIPALWLRGAAFLAAYRKPCLSDWTVRSCGDASLHTIREINTRHMISRKSTRTI